MGKEGSVGQRNACESKSERGTLIMSLDKSRICKVPKSL